MKKWDKEVLRVAFLGGRGGAALHREVLRYASEWSEFSGIEFQLVNSSEAEIRVGFQENPRASDGGHWSYVGMDSINQVSGKSMNLAINMDSLNNNRYHQAVVRHEFGHALGCIHEHQNPGEGGIRFDRNKTIDYFQRTYGWSSPMTIDNVLTRYAAGELQRFSDFDPDSIMLYKYPGRITVDGQGTKQNYDLSPVDKEYIALLYGQDPPTRPSNGEQPSSTKTLPTDGTPVSNALSPTVLSNKYTFEITDSGSYLIWTEGYTQVVLKLSKADGTDLGPRTTTPDLVNRRAGLDLVPGKYILEVRHTYAKGTGGYRIHLKKL